ncbi:cyclin-dependent kinase B2-1-like [Iris pallida]|uniref:Cyclin-dependent kinase B2-1-like n=1 Tax=Iris pallida TaxID=29817 RepID=A0AAX6EVW5_IRIPA|nr:cyclin-dependent kinase B2-1-like [Iris pallida]
MVPRLASLPTSGGPSISTTSSQRLRHHLPWPHPRCHGLPPGSSKILDMLRTRGGWSIPEVCIMCAKEMSKCSSLSMLLAPKIIKEQSAGFEITPAAPTKSSHQTVNKRRMVVTVTNSCNSSFTFSGESTSNTWSS